VKNVLKDKGFTNLANKFQDFFLDGDERNQWGKENVGVINVNEGFSLQLLYKFSLLLIDKVNSEPLPCDPTLEFDMVYSSNSNHTYIYLARGHQSS